VSTLIVIAKAPVAGRVKTRLTPPFTPQQAAELAAAALHDTLAAVAATAATTRLLVLDGAPDPSWLPPGFLVVPQVAGTLDRRLAAAFAEAARRDPGPALLVGMDTPQVTPELLTACLPQDTADEGDAVFGPATDGGFWSLGFRRPTEVDLDAVLLGVPMSTDETGAVQLARLWSAGLKVRLLPELCDVDTVTDAEQVAKLRPQSRFATAFEAMAMPVAAVPASAAVAVAVAS
jgi:rSAM/selenodomain-associated transferase 1